MFKHFGSGTFLNARFGSGTKSCTSKKLLSPGQNKNILAANVGESYPHYSEPLASPWSLRHVPG
jgi:hypothetical protein